MEINNLRTTPASGDSIFLTTPFKGKNAFWRYFVLAVLPFIVTNTIGAIPILVVMFSHMDSGTLVTKGGMPDFASLGIDLNVGFFVSVFPFLLAFLTMVLLLKPFHERSFRTVINGGRKIRWGRMFVSAGVWTAVCAVWLFFSIKRDPSNFVLNNVSGSLITLAILSLILIPFQAGFEEVLFRGYLNQGFAVLSRNRWLPILVTSVLFGLMHSLNPEVAEYGFLTMIPQYMFFGLVFSVLSMMDDGIEMAIGAHTANNVFLSIFVTTKDSALQTPAMYEQVVVHPWHEFIGLILMSVVFLAIIAVIYRWKDVWKLYGKIEPPASEETGLNIQMP